MGMVLLVLFLYTVVEGTAFGPDTGLSLISGSLIALFLIVGAAIVVASRSQPLD
ncbi:MAG: hypothetical protein JRN44_01965 [Nitrososphaerota archaeon]|jgi:hypothetical protein|nr:hypothetical protein [Nitrososphaerota archaeon]MDG6947271.1 hypothetical protein [Nitrososphaerota archaeon]